MTRDRREEILARILEVLAAVPGIVKTGRNVEDVSGKSRPAAILHDGVEEERDAGFGGAPNSQAQMMRLSPQIVLMLGAPGDLLGPLVSRYRAAILAAVLNDARLIELGGGPRRQSIRFRSFALETVTGETREATAILGLTFDYPFALSELI